MRGMNRFGVIENRPNYLEGQDSSSSEEEPDLTPVHGRQSTKPIFVSPQKISVNSNPFILSTIGQITEKGVNMPASILDSQTSITLNRLGSKEDTDRKLGVDRVVDNQVSIPNFDFLTGERQAIPTIMDFETFNPEDEERMRDMFKNSARGQSSRRKKSLSQMKEFLENDTTNPERQKITTGAPSLTGIGTSFPDLEMRPSLEIDILRDTSKPNTRANNTPEYLTPPKLHARFSDPPHQNQPHQRLNLSQYKPQPIPPKSMPKSNISSPIKGSLPASPEKPKGSSNAPIIPGFTKYMIDKDHQEQCYLPRFSDDEILDVFNGIDFRKDGYITVDELRFFLDLLEEDYVEEEIKEMIDMLDTDYIEKVKFEDFFRLATGKGLNPIAQGFPVNWDILGKLQKADSMTRQSYHHGEGEQEPELDLGMMIKKSNNETLSTQEELMKNKFKKSHGGKNLDILISPATHKTTVSNKDILSDIMSYFFQEIDMGIPEFLDKYEQQLANEKKKMSKFNYEDFCKFFGLANRKVRMEEIENEDDDYYPTEESNFEDKSASTIGKRLFDHIGQGKKTVDMRIILIAILILLPFSLDQKIELAYHLYDADDNGFIMYTELQRIFYIFQLGEKNQSIDKKLKTLLNKPNISPDEFISREEFIKICKNYPNIFES